MCPMHMANNPIPVVKDFFTIFFHGVGLQDFPTIFHIIGTTNKATIRLLSAELLITIMLRRLVGLVAPNGKGHEIHNTDICIHTSPTRQTEILLSVELFIHGVKIQDFPTSFHHGVRQLPIFLIV